MNEGLGELRVSKTLFYNVAEIEFVADYQKKEYNINAIF